MLTPLRRAACLAAAVGLLLSSMVLDLFAQQPGTPGQPVQIAPAKSYTLEGILVGLLIGVAVWSVCRSSRRS